MSLYRTSVKAFSLADLRGASAVEFGKLCLSNCWLRKILQALLGKINRGWRPTFWLLAGLMLPAFVQALSDVEGIYVIEQPVEAQTDAERTRVAAEGLLTVLTRLTGLVSIPRNEQVVAALGAPQAYYNRFLFFTKSRPDGSEQQILKITYQTAAIQKLIEQASLPVWWAKRPKVVAWVVLESGGERRILSDDQRHPLVQALRARGELRGVPLSLPRMDLSDSVAISAAEVWGKLGQSLDAAAARYQADIVLVGRVARSADFLSGTKPYRGDWEAWVEGQLVAVNFDSLNAEQVAGLGVDLIADQVMEQYAVLPRGIQSQSLRVSGLYDIDDYAQLMQYLEGLEFVADVGVTELSPNTVNLSVTSRAQQNQLEMLLTTEGYLTKDRLHRGRDSRFIWRQ